METHYLVVSVFIRVHLWLNFLQPAQSINLRVDVFRAELLPVVGDVYQFAADVIGLFRSQEEGQVNLLLGRDAAGLADFQRFLGFPVVAGGGLGRVHGHAGVRGVDDVAVLIVHRQERRGRPEQLIQRGARSREAELPVERIHGLGRTPVRRKRRSG